MLRSDPKRFYWAAPKMGQRFLWTLIIINRLRKRFMTNGDTEEPIRTPTPLMQLCSGYIPNFRFLRVWIYLSWGKTYFPSEALRR